MAVSSLGSSTALSEVVSALLDGGGTSAAVSETEVELKRCDDVAGSCGLVGALVLSSFTWRSMHRLDFKGFKRSL